MESYIEPLDVDIDFVNRDNTRDPKVLQAIIKHKLPLEFYDELTKSYQKTEELSYDDLQALFSFTDKNTDKFIDEVPKHKLRDDDAGNVPRMKIEKINDIKPEVVVVEDNLQQPNKLFNVLYPNIAIIARKNSGKTTLINTILHNLNRPIILFMFATTANLDPALKQIGEDFNADISHEVNIDFDRLEANAIAVRNDKVKNALMSLELTPDIKRALTSLLKKITQVCVFDDLTSDELKDPSLYSLIKKNRHLQTITIISSQALIDAPPKLRKNIDIWCLGGGLSEPDIRKVYGDSMPSVSYEVFKNMYDMATAKKYNFFVYDTRANKYKINFNYEFA
jgi:hypothetical protein